MLKHIYDCGMKKMVEKERQLDNGRKQRNNKIKIPFGINRLSFFSAFYVFFSHRIQIFRCLAQA